MTLEATGITVIITEAVWLGMDLAAAVATRTVFSLIFRWVFTTPFALTEAALVLPPASSVTVQVIWLFFAALFTASGLANSAVRVTFCPAFTSVTSAVRVMAKSALFVFSRSMMSLRLA